MLSVQLLVHTVVGTAALDMKRYHGYYPMETITESKGLIGQKGADASNIIQSTASGVTIELMREEQHLKYKITETTTVTLTKVASMIRIS